MAERSFKAQVEDLMLGEGETFTGEGILAITKALLESGVGYVGGYQGAPISHLMDVLADAEEVLAELGVRYEANANEAAAAAMLAASVHYPIRGAVTFKGPVGAWIFDHISQETFDTWIKQGTKVINELRLDLSNDEGSSTYDRHMREYLGIDDELYARLVGDPPR